ncbi:MAG: hemin receptor, partial [Prevotella sp.]|nr:hemin receptor [Prevotella sp.]
MKKILYICLSLLATMPMMAQETYENANVATEDLNGTARYVGMGGAMEALGADISTIGTNPAGIGLFRHSNISTSFGVVSQQDAKDFDFGNKTNMSFDQIGFVYAHRTGVSSFMNFGFNYHKSRNFNHILSVSDNLNGASSNKISYAKGYAGLFDLSTKDEEIVGNSNAFSQVDFLNYNVLLQDNDGNYYYNDANSYLMNRANKGYIGEYDFNLSGNINDRVYLGLTLGIEDVNYKNYSEYSEYLVGAGNVTYADERRIDGSGFNLKLGAIFRPVEASPFRVGLYVHTPTWYDLTASNYTSMTTPYGSAGSGEDYDFKLYSPWKFGISMGHTVGNYLALGARYEFADYAHLDTRYNTGGYYDYWGGYSETSESDDIMNDHTKQTLKGVSTLKLGVEFKPYPELAVRLGYNYVSPMYKPDGFKDGTWDTDGSYYSSATDYTNWEGTNRITAGLGYTFGKLN